MCCPALNLETKERTSEPKGRTRVKKESKEKLKFQEKSENENKIPRHRNIKRSVLIKKFINVCVRERYRDRSRETDREERQKDS